VLWNFDGLLTR